VEWTGPPDSDEPASMIEVVSGGSEHPQASPQPPDASASQKAAGGQAEVLAETGGTNLAVYAGLGFVGVVVSALLARRLLG
jgi:hypothetical protein